MPQKVWFVTGASRGFGRIWTEAALKRGDKVAATARRLDAVADLSKAYGDLVLPLALDVNDRAAVFAAVGAAHRHFGRIDVAVANAGYGLFGALEEVTEEQARAQIETNLFGAMWLLQASLPIMRAQRSGHLLSVSSIGGLVGLPNVSLYQASKFALEGLNEALAHEVEALGIKVTLLEPAGYATDWAGPSAAHAAAMSSYDQARVKLGTMLQDMKPGDPHATAAAVLSVVDSAEPPRRLLLGSFALPLVRENYARKLAEWEAWESVSAAAQ